ncbi:hypothetical protein EDM57_04715 [Brevibacillus gelatini]|uniref:Uncharacterized protein n=1 Tax=Brevibacillus gelatini TaxID=1655277 RepID=A0A3M8B7P8_9BACL|nr:hypothetical protein [Brevibacillus gelatini]RNB59448.1 hypothetical protein EDM57_04715 [Brevibacillus gelatini]
MTPNFILVQAEQKVKSEVFGNIVLRVETLKTFEPLTIELKIHTLSGVQHVVKVHDWKCEWQDEIDDKWYGEMQLVISYSFEVNEEDALYAANCSISELNAIINEVITNEGSLKVNDFLIEWGHVYGEQN